MVEKKIDSQRTRRGGSPPSRACELCSHCKRQNQILFHSPADCQRKSRTEPLMQPLSLARWEKSVLSTAGELKLYPGGRKCSIGEKEFIEGDVISLDGTSGEVYEGEVEITFEKPVELLEMVDVWKREQAA